MATAGLLIILALVLLGGRRPLPLEDLPLHGHEAQHEVQPSPAGPSGSENPHHGVHQVLVHRVDGLHAPDLHGTGGNDGIGVADSDGAGATEVRVWRVTPQGPLTLADAVRKAQAGDVIQMAAGVYQQHLHIDKPLHLMAEPGAVLEGGEQPGDVLIIEGDGVVVRGLTIHAPAARTHGDHAAIKIRGNRNLLENLRVVSAGHGIYIERGDGNTVVGSRIEGWPGRDQDDLGNGIHLFDAEKNRLLNNTIEAVRDGIYLSFAAENTIQDNRVTRSRYAIHEMYSRGNRFIGNRLWANVGGGALMFSRQSVLEGNLFAYHPSHRGYGLLLKDSNQNRLRHNRFVHNRTGLFMDMSSQNEVVENDIHDNGIGMDVLSSSEQNRFFGNNFAANQSDVRINRGRHRNRWDDGQGRGNYWAAYRGIDLDGDGAGDLPHRAGTVLGQWAGENPLLWALQHSPAAMMLDKLEQLMPSWQAPKVEDSHPLMQPVHTLSPSSYGFTETDAGGAEGGTRSPFPGHDRGQ